MALLTFERILDAPKIAIDHGGSGELLVFMHGIGGNRTNWADQLTVFSDRCHALAWDARGYGDSDDYEGPLDFGDFAGDLLKLLDHFGVEKAHLCGLSMGGRIAQDFIARFPDRVATLALVSTFAGQSNFTPEERQRFVDLRKKPLVEEGKEPKDIAPVVAKTLIGPNATEAQFQRLVASMSALHKESYIKTVEATTLYERTGDLAKISVPTLLIYGDDDQLTTPEIANVLHDGIKGSELVRLPVGHLVNLETPDEFNAALGAFLDKHMRPAA